MFYGFRALGFRALGSYGFRVDFFFLHWVLALRF